MTKTTKTILWVIGIIIVVVVIALATSKPAANNGPLKLGFIGPLSGEAASYGETEKNATELAVKEINAAGGVGGRQIEVIYEDGKCSGKDATTAMQKLVNVDKVNIVLGGTCSGETLAAAPIALQNHVILLSAFSSNPQISTFGNYVFRNSPSDSDVATLDANYIAARYKSVAVISENSDYAQGVRTIMMKIFNEKGLKVTNDEVYGGLNSNVTDFRSTIQKIESSHPEVIYVNPTSGKMGGLIVKQIRQVDRKTPIAANFSLATPDAYSVAGADLDGVVVSDSSGLAANGQTVLAKYKEIYKADPANAYEMGSSYDRVYLISQAVKAAGEDTDKIRDYLHGLPNFDGAVGSYHFAPNGDLIGVGFVNFVMKGGKEMPIAK